MIKMVLSADPDALLKSYLCLFEGGFKVGVAVACMATQLPRHAVVDVVIHH